MFGFNLDRRLIYAVIGVLAVLSIFSFANNPDSLLSLILTMPGVIIAITFHEYAHAFVADKLGDDTPRREDRLTLNPLKHMDVIGFALLLFAHFGWGKPVNINERNFSRKRSVSAQVALVSLAGPLMNMILALILIIVRTAVMTYAYSFVMTKTGLIIALLLENTIIVNLGLGIFNLIPLPPLDGSKILAHFLPYNAKAWFAERQQIFYIIFLVLWVTNLIGYIIEPILIGVYNGLNWVVASIFSLF